jgi:hypothetical protein
MLATRAPLVVALLAATTIPAWAKLPACPGGRYLVMGPPLVAAGGGAGTLDAVELSGRTLAIASGCDAVKARVRATRAGTKLSARWPSCHGMAGKALLKGTITDACRTLAATFTVPSSRTVEPFIAALSLCGDGVWDPDAGEECDGALGPCPGLCTACRCGGVTTTTVVVTTTTMGGVTSTTAIGVTTTTVVGTTTTLVGGSTTTTAIGSTTTTHVTSTSTTTAAAATTTTTTSAGSTTTGSPTFTVPSTTSSTTTTTIIAPDLTPIAFLPPTTIVAGASVSMDYTVKNQGTATAVATWYDYIILSTNQTLDGGDTPVGAFPHGTNLLVGASYAPTQTFPFADVAPGPYYLYLLTDAAGQVTETNENNNADGPVAITVIAPDLLPTAFTPPASGTHGTQVTMGYTVKNQGSANALGSWSDSIMISASSVYDGSASPLATFANGAALGINGTYSASPMVTLPSTPGTYYLFFVTDSANQVHEGGVKANNVSAAHMITVS